MRLLIVSPDLPNGSHWSLELAWSNRPEPVTLATTRSCALSDARLTLPHVDAIPARLAEAGVHFVGASVVGVAPPPAPDVGVALTAGPDPDGVTSGGAV